MSVRSLMLCLVVVGAQVGAQPVGRCALFSESLPPESVTLPGDMAGRLLLLRETLELMEMLHTVVDAPGLFVAPEEMVRGIADKWLLPRWRELQRLSQAELRELCLLADAIDWQSSWLLDMAEGESCVAIPREENPLTCLERLQKTARAVQQLLNRKVELELKAELRRVLAKLGGEEVLRLPDALLEQRLARDYKTAYSFFSEFKAALMQEDVPAMQALTVYTDYLLQSEADVLRVNALAGVYASVCREEYKVRPPAFRLSPAMQQALLPLVAQLPALQGVYEEITINENLSGRCEPPA